jgi:alpha-galactosidase
MNESTSSAARGTSISFQKSGERNTARYVSATTVCEEGMQDSRWIGLYWSAAGEVQRQNMFGHGPGVNLSEFPLHAFDLEIDGQDLRNRWLWKGASERRGAVAPDGNSKTVEAIVALSHQVRPVSINVITRLDGTPFLARRLEITNTGAEPAALSHLSPWSGMLWSISWQEERDEVADEATSFSLGFFRSPAKGSEGDFVWEPLPRGVRRIESGTGHSGHGNPFFIVRNGITGQTAIGSLAYSGNWFAEFWLDPHLTASGRSARGVHLSFRMGPRAPAPLRVIAAGETIVTPETHLAILHAGTDACIAELHEHLRRSVIPPRPAKKEYFIVAGRVVEEPGSWILNEIDIAAEMGVHAFMVDAGWFGEKPNWWLQRGNWEVGDWMPGGLKACRDRCHDRGLMFGLWMEPEGVGDHSRLLREHPDWLLRTDGERNPALPAHTLDLGHPDAAAFMTQQVLRVIREHRPDFFKLDYNLGVFEGGQRLRDGWLEHESWRHYEVMYDLFDQVRREFPEVALENCSAGGGRNDLGMLSHFHYAAISDFSMFPRSIRAINGLTMFLPPEALCYYHNHMPSAHLKADLDTHLRVTLFVQPFFVGFGAQDADRSTAYYDKTRRYIRLIKELAAPILAAKPSVYHHTPGIGLSQPADWCVLEYASPDRSRGYVGVFKLTSGEKSFRLTPKGIDRGAEYEVTLDNENQTFRAPGRELADQGLTIQLDAANTSELVIFSKVRA